MDQPNNTITDTNAISNAPQEARQLAMVEADTSDMFSTLGGFDLASRMAKTLSKSTLLPAIYQGENGEGNCLVLLDVASRFKKLGISPFTVAQQLVPVHGKFGWQGQFVIAIINLSARYAEPLQFRFDGDGDQYGCTAFTQRHDGTTVEGVKITRAMVQAEGWTRNAKWKNMEQQMFMYRAASFFGRIHVPDLLMGYQTSEEIEDVGSKAKDLIAAAATSGLIDAVKGDDGQ